MNFPGMNARLPIGIYGYVSTWLEGCIVIECWQLTMADRVVLSGKVFSCFSRALWSFWKDLRRSISDSKSFFWLFKCSDHCWKDPASSPSSDSIGWKTVQVGALSLLKETPPPKVYVWDASLSKCTWFSDVSRKVDCLSPSSSIAYVDSYVDIDQ